MPKGPGLLRVDPEPHSCIPSLKTGLGAAERVKRKKWTYFCNPSLRSKEKHLEKNDPSPVRTRLLEKL